MDHTSPWFLPNNGLFNWDLNIEMTWWSIAGANRPQLIEPLLHLLEQNAGDFCENVVSAARDPKGCAGAGPFATLAGPSAHTGYVSIGRIQVGHGTPSTPDRSIEPPGPLGDLSWTLHNVEQTWRFTRNMTTTKRLWPLLSGAADYYVHWLSNKTSSAPDGRYHLPPTHSPEFLKGPGDGDTSYELAIARWGFGAALRLASELGVQDARTSVWQDRFDNLANYSIDPIRGLNAKNLPFDVPHRHFSHLMGVVLKEPALCANTSVIATSVDKFWRSFRDPCVMPDRPNISDPGFVGSSIRRSCLRLPEEKEG